MTAAHRTSEAANRRRRSGARAGALIACFLSAATGAAAEPGGPVEPADTAASSSAVEVLRGSVADPAVRVEPAAGPDRRRTVGGERVWFVDEARGTLTGCRLINTIDVGRQAIRCTERPLPRGRPARN